MMSYLAAVSKGGEQNQVAEQVVSDPLRWEGGKQGGWEGGWMSGWEGGKVGWREGEWEGGWVGR